MNLRITVSPNKADTSEEDYNCPLYVNPSFVNNIAAKTGLDSLPVCYESMQVNSINANSRKLRHSSFMATNETLVKRSNFPMLYVTIPSMENIEECACKNVILTSSR